MQKEYVQLLQYCEEDLQNIQRWINKNPVDTNVGYLTRYSIVRSSGTIESVFKQMLYDYLCKDATVEIKNYLNTQIINSSANPSVYMMRQMILQFSKDLSEAFEGSISDNDKAALGNLVSARNDVAHGRDNNMTMRAVVTAFECGRNILGALDSLLHPTT